MSNEIAYLKLGEDQRGDRIKRAIQILSIEGAKLSNPLFFEDLRGMLAELLRRRHERSEGICLVCGCSEDHACIVAGQPCAWTSAARILCTACAHKLLTGAIAA